MFEIENLQYNIYFRGFFIETRISKFASSSALALRALVSDYQLILLWRAVSKLFHIFELVLNPVTIGTTPSALQTNERINNQQQPSSITRL